LSKLKEALLKLGLSESEIRAYLKLLEEGPLTAMDLSRKAGVPYSKVYEVLKRLEEKGWIVAASGGRPTLFSARPPREAVEIWRARRDMELREYEEIAVKELSRMMPVYPQERQDVWIARGLGVVVANLASMVSECKEELLVALPPELGEGLNVMIDSLRASEKPVRILAPNRRTAGLIAASIPSAHIKIKTGMFGGGVICGTSGVMLLLGEKSRGEPYLAIRAEHPGLSIIAKSYFEFLWDQAYEYEKKQ